MNESTRPRLLPLGFALLLMSLIFALIVPQSGSSEGASITVWIENATLWLGIVCIAGHVFSMLLDHRDQDLGRRA